MNNNRLLMERDPNDASYYPDTGDGCRLIGGGFPWYYQFFHNSQFLKSLELPCPWIRSSYEEQYTWNFGELPNFKDLSDDAYPESSEVCAEMSPIQYPVSPNSGVPGTPTFMASKMVCPSGVSAWRCEYWSSFQMPVGHDWRLVNMDLGRMLYLVYRYCSWSAPDWTQGNMRLVNIEQNEYVYSHILANRADAICQSCVPGRFKDTTSNLECENCAVDSFTVEHEQTSCVSCEDGKSTAGLTGKSHCECDAGTQRGSFDLLAPCLDCEYGKFKSAPSYEQPNCTDCAVCAVNEQVATESPLTSRASPDQQTATTRPRGPNSARATVMPGMN